MQELATEPDLDAFAVRMLSAICGNRGSCVVSPASAFVALEALARGSEGETFEEINVALGGEAARAAVLDVLFGKAEAWQSDERDFTFRTSVWADPCEVPLRGSYKRSLAKLNAEAFAGNLQSDGLRFQMAKWLARNTGGKFSTAPNCGADATLVLMSALHFKDAWVDRFDEEIEMAFSAADAPQTVQAMVGLGKCGWLINDADGTAVQWPMMSRASVVFAKPSGAGGIDEFVSSGAAWRLIARCRERRGAERPAGGIELTVPLLDLRTDGTGLVELLKSMGVRRAFSPVAQLSGMTEANAMVDSVSQNALFKLDLDGAEGAAFTLVEVAAAGIPEEWPSAPVKVTFDRPFAFALFTSAGAPLFVGVYRGEVSGKALYEHSLANALRESRTDFEEGDYYSNREDLLVAVAQKRGIDRV